MKVVAFIEPPQGDVYLTSPDSHDFIPSPIGNQISSYQLLGEDLCENCPRRTTSGAGQRDILLSDLTQCEMRNTGQRAEKVRWGWFFSAALLVTVFLVYQPAWQGGLIWDDTEHVTRPELRSWHGLYRIWFDVGATPQYYPLVHSVFWVEHKLWGDATLGYHLVNILLHATAALMVARDPPPAGRSRGHAWRRRSSPCTRYRWNRWPGSRNSRTRLSAVFYLGATMFYLRFDQTRKTGLVPGCPGTVPCWPWPARRSPATLPGALLVIFWWQRGRLVVDSATSCRSCPSSCWGRAWEWSRHGGNWSSISASGRNSSSPGSSGS